ETKVSFISHGSIARTRKDMNKPPTFLFLDDSLVKEQRADPEEPNPPPKTRRQPGCPTHTAHPQR
ncbi:hypothetical protein, partial [Methylorubrum populi]|uniref:hypothetical protein n=1 Tax=Methylorubrum populi TaxID=223967 RepID=UPI001AF012F6